MRPPSGYGIDAHRLCHFSCCRQRLLTCILTEMARVYIEGASMKPSFVKWSVVVAVLKIELGFDSECRRPLKGAVGEGALCRSS